MASFNTYILFTTIAKKVGGPVGLLSLTAAGGYAILRTGEAGVKGIVRVAKSASEKRKNPAVGQGFTVTADGDADGGLALRVGDEFRVLEGNGEPILIEVLGDADNPYYATSEFLSSVSNFSAEDAAGE